MARSQVLGEPDGTGNIDAARSAQAQSFLSGELKHGLYRLRVGDLKRGVNRCAFKVLGDAALADPLRDRRALCFQLAGRVVGVERGAGRVGQRGADGGTLGFEHTRYTSQRASRTDGCNETVNLAIRIGPNFLSRCRHMDVAVGDVVELIGPYRAFWLTRIDGLGEAR